MSIEETWRGTHTSEFLHLQQLGAMPSAV